MAHKFVYCIVCEEWVERFVLPVWGEIHQIDIPMLDDSGEVVGSDKELCYFEGGYSFIAPPQINPNWNIGLAEPGEDVIEPELEVELPVVVEV